MRISRVYLFILVSAFFHCHVWNWPIAKVQAPLAATFYLIAGHLYRGFAKIFTCCSRAVLFSIVPKVHI